jgi:pimeloyl-[acyl-carrier protein] methyl ester esterase
MRIPKLNGRQGGGIASGREWIIVAGGLTGHHSKAMTLVLLPGLDGTGLLFQPLVDALPESIESIIVRYPGDRWLTYEQLLPIVLATLPKDEPFLLLGESFSGPLGIMIAATHPPGLLGLILVASFIQSPRRFLRPAISLFSRAPLFSLYLPYKHLKAIINRCYTPQHRELLSQMQQLVRPHVIAARVRIVFQVNAEPALRACNVPMLYIQATKDQVVPARNLRLIQKIKPVLEVVKIDSPHMVLQRFPDGAAQAIARFGLALAESQ